MIRCQVRSDVGRRNVAAGMIDEEMARTAGHTSRCSPPVQVHLDQESLAQQSSNLEARIDRGSSNNVTMKATSLDRAAHIRQIRVLLAASRCATAQSKENPGILSQCHGKRDKKPSAASPRNCLLSKSGLPHHLAPQKAMMRAPPCFVSPKQSCELVLH